MRSWPVLLSLLWTSTLFAQQSVNPTPPFQQCPPVGADTSCAILIEIDTFGSLRVFTDPSQGPYDTIEDTLIGVQNNSTNTILSIPLNSVAPIFAFDRDGICGNSPITGVPYVPAPAGCPFGSTGYEGPNVSFTIGTVYSGVVNFPLGLVPGTSTYFSLEGAIQTQCPAINAPNRLTQNDPRWGGQLIDSTAWTIADYGCYITSAAMMINYHAAKQGSTFRTDPGKLNTFLSNDDIVVNGMKVNIGYGFEGVAGSANPFEIAKYATNNGVTLFYAGPVDHRDDFTLDQYLCNGEPPLLAVGSPHWVLPTGQTTVNGIATYSDLDPDTYPNGSTLQGWNYTYSFIDLFTEVVGPLSGLYAIAHSPVELMLAGPNGGQTGFNPLLNTRLDSIPSSGYELRFLANDQTHSGATTEPVKFLAVVGPLSGSYTLQAIGTESGPYSIRVLGYDTNGNASTQTVKGTVSPGDTFAYNVEYSSVPGSQTQVAGIPKLAGAITSSIASGQKLTVTLQFTNTGIGSAEKVTINSLVFRTLGGTGAVTLSSPDLPASLGSIGVKETAELAAVLNVPSTVTKFSITENGTIQDTLGKAYNYSIGQIVLH